jgi:predicted molibdopterin-dependent oxidoreductase YjgC
MAETVSVYVNGRAIAVPAGSTAAVAVLLAGNTCRTSVSGEPRAPFCGMGTCFECRVQINGVLHLRSCQVVCEPKMEIKSHE